MHSAFVFLGLIAIASASPIAPRSYPPTFLSKGFALVANVTDLSSELSSKVHLRQITAWHQLAHLSRATPTVGKGDIFYQNGTTDTDQYFSSTLLTELGVNTAGLQINLTDTTATKYDMGINLGSGEKGVMLISQGSPISYVSPFEKTGAPSTFVVCNETIPWVSKDENDKFLALDWLLGSVNENGQWGLWVPKGCVSVKLLPQCTPLPDVPVGSAASHDFAQEVRCYEDVSAIDWTVFPMV